MSIDWGEIDKNSNSQSFKSYAPNGEYKVKLDHVEVRDKDTWKSPAMVFHWKDTDEYKFPKSATHWLSIPNPSWRAVHNRNILMQFGVEKKKAEELVEAAERDQDRLKLIKGYEELYKRLAERGNEVEITVHDQYDRDGNPICSKNGVVYGETDFLHPTVRMANKPKQATLVDQMAQDEPINLNDIPF